MSKKSKFVPFNEEKHTPGAQQSAISIYEKFIELKLANGDYLDAVNIRSTLAGDIAFIGDVERRHRNLEQKNNMIDSIIESYVHARCIRIYSELEQSILETFTRFFKRNDFNSMDRLGVGNLLKHRLILQYFGTISNKSSRSAVTTKTIVELFMRFRLQHRERKSDFWSSPKCNDDFIKFIVAAVGNDAGYSIDVKNFYHATGAHLQVRNQLKQLSDNSFTEQIGLVRKAISTLLNRPDISASIDERNKIIDGHKKSVREMFRKLSASIIPFSDYYSQVFNLCKNWMNVDGMWSNVAAAVVPIQDVTSIQSILSSNPKKDDDREFVYAQPLQKGAFNSISLTLVLLLQYLATYPGDSTAPTTGDSPSMEASVKVALRANLKGDIPESHLEMLESFILNVMRYEGAMKVTSSFDGKHFKLSLDYTLIEVRIHEILTTKAVLAGTKVRIGISMYHLIACVTGLIIFSRVSQVESRASADGKTLTVVNEAIAASHMMLLDESDPLVCVLGSLRNLEELVLAALAVPAFECMGHGSLLSLIMTNPDVYAALKRGWKEGLASITRPDMFSENPDALASTDEGFVFDNEEEWVSVVSDAIDELSLRIAESTGEVTVVEALSFLEKQMSSFSGTPNRNSFLEQLHRMLVEDESVRNKLTQLTTMLSAREAVDPIQVTEHEVRAIAEPKYSPAILEGAIVQFLTSPARTFKSVDSAFNAASELLVESYELPRSDANLLVHSVIRTSCLNFDPSVNSFRSHGASHSAVVLDTTLDEHLLRNIDTMDCIEQLTVLIAATPFGCSCLEYSMWNSVFRSHCANYPSLLDFILAHETALLSLRPGIRILRIPKTFDCILIPTIVPSAFPKLLSVALDQDHPLVASYAMSAVVGVLREDFGVETPESGRKVFRDHIRIRFLTLYEISGTDYLIESSINVAGSLPCGFGQVPILQQLFQVILETSKVTKMGTLEDRAIELCLRGGAGDAERLRVLVSVGMNGNGCFPTLYRFSTDFLRKSELSNIHIPSAHIPSTSVAITAAEQFHSTSHEVPIPIPSVAVIAAAARLPEMEVMDNFLKKYKAGAVMNCRDAILELYQIKVSTKSQDLLRAVDELSGKLYSSNVHFVMELIQNADDNMYVSGETPTVKFELYEHALLVFNNELGFKLDNIVAICGVGASTKKGLTGFIGQKGIGFKSVFSVSETPEIHSGGFHVRYNSTISMLEPIWIDENPGTPWPKEVDPDDGTVYGTCLRLKFDAKTLNDRPHLTERLNDVFNDKLLLFLNKLQRMIWEDRNRDLKIEHRRIDLSQDWTILNSQKSIGAGSVQFNESYWYIRRLSIFNPVVLRNNVRIDATVLAVGFKFKKAFSLSNEEGDDDESDDGFAMLDLEFDICDERFPIFAFLPTATEAFRFVVQGDFLLPTNRESIMETDEWNQVLLGRIPELFANTLQDLFDYWENIAGNRQITGPFAELHAAGYRVKCSESRIFDLVPVHSEVPKVYKRVADGIYERLQHMRIFRSESGHLCAPSELFAVDHLPFDISVISEELVFSIFGRRFLKTTNYFEFSGELLGLLHIPRFDANCVVKLLENLQGDGNDVGDSGIWISTLKLIGSLLLCMQLLMPTALPAAHSSITSRVPNSIIPSQVVAHAPPIAKSTMQRDTIEIIARLRTLRIWPTTAQKLINLAPGVTLFIKSNSDLDKVAGNLCLNEFQDELSFLDERMFSSVCDDSALNGIFRPADLKGFQTFVINAFSSNGQLPSLNGCGCIQRLTSNIVLTAVILPSYKRLIAEADNNRIVQGISRDKAAAMLAFVFLCSNSKPDRKRVFESKLSVIVPVISAHDSNKKEIMWKNPANTVLNRHLDVDIHLGTEFEHSTTSYLVNLPLGSCLRQLEWTVIDPLVAAYSFGRQDLIQQWKRESQISTTNICKGLWNTPVATLNGLQAFFQQLGVVNFFSVNPPEKDKSQAPSLMKFIGHLTRNATRVFTSSLTSIKHADCIAEDSDEEEDASDLHNYIPIFLPNAPESSRPHMLGVSAEVHASLIAIVPLVLQELSFVKNVNYELFLEELNNTPWFPVHIHPLLSVKFSSELTSKHFLARPINIIAAQSDFESRKFLLGPHAAYIPHSIYDCSVQKLSAFFRFYSTSYNQEDPYLLSSFLLWMSHQSSSLFSSTSYMCFVYYTLFQYMDSHHDQVRVMVVNLIQQDSPFLWIPSKIQTQEDDCKPSDYYEGAMVSLSKVSKEGLDHRLNFDASPIKVLGAHYCAQEFRLMTSMFSRQRCCKLCRAIEGMFGTHGQPIEGAKDIVLSPNYSATIKMSCECKFGDFLGFEKFVPSSRGLVRLSPSIFDLIALLRYHKSIAVDSLTELQLRSSMREEEILLSRKNTSFREIMDILATLSSNIWKTFIKDSLHPYSPSSLFHLRDIFQSEALLPTKSCTEFIAAAVTDTIVCVDDVFMFDLFESYLLEVNGDIQFVSGQRLDDVYSPLERVYLFDIHRVKGKLDIDDVCKDVQALLSSEPVRFREITSRDISPMTFLGPRGTTALMQLLGVPLLSQYVTCTVDMVFAESTKVTSNFAAITNNLLLMTQAFLIKNGINLLAKNRFGKFVDMKIYACKSLCLEYTLGYMGMLKSLRKDVNHHYASAADDSYFVAIHDSIQESALQDFAASLVFAVVRIEVTLNRYNQEVELMRELESLLRKFSKSGSSFMKLLEIEGLLEFSALQEQDHGRSTISQWSLQYSSAAAGHSSLVSSLSNDEKIEATDAEESEFLKGYRREQEALKQRRKELALKQSTPRDVQDRPGLNDPDNVTDESRRDHELLTMAKRNARIHEEQVGIDASVEESTESLPSELTIVEYPMLAGQSRGPTDHSPVAVPSDQVAVMVVDLEGKQTSTGQILPREASSRVQFRVINFTTSPPLGRSTAEVHSIQVPDSRLMEILEESQQRPLQAHRNEESLDVFSGALSGRLGEQIAYSVLQSVFISRDLVAPTLTLSSDTICTHITWINQESEVGHPYDITLEFKIKGAKVFKYCEVKTRTVTTTSKATHFAISPSEIRKAIESDENYFCILVSLSTGAGAFTLHDISAIGFKRGLFESLKSDEAKLLLQIQA